MPTTKKPKPVAEKRPAQRKSPVAKPLVKRPKAETKKPASAPRLASNRLPSRRVEKYHQRIETLFTDIDRLANEQASVTPEVRLKLETLNSRLQALEAQVSGGTEDAAQPAAAIQNVLTSRILYDRDRVGYVFTGERLQEVRSVESFAGLSPDVAAPLTDSGQPIGEVGLASPPERPITPEETGLLHSVAQQASLQIQSLRLLAETERARAEAESATRRFMHESWDSYLDAINQNERVGYAYDQSSVEPFLEKPENGDTIREVVQVMDEQVGALYLKPDPTRPLVENDKEMIAAVASQIAQQVENIRLLADASRARAEADEVIRRVTREGWETYVADKEEKSLQFVYDAIQVRRTDDKWSSEEAMATFPLQVRGETIGQLAVSGAAQVSPEAVELANAIAAQASTHLETLRLNEELQKRAAELMELDRLKSSFLANMSHELRTPLNSILGFADVIVTGLDGPLTENMETDLKLVQKNGQHLLNLINDVLDMAKIEAGRMNLNLEKFVLDEVLEEVVNITSPLASEKNLALFVEDDSDKDVPILADRTRLRQIMINLVNNAIKFTEKGKIAVRVDRLRSDKILIRVKDTGIGIPPDKLEVIFQEFAQVDTSTTRKAGGTGLGLPISRKLVEMHGGRLWVESSGVNGEGSTFYVELPLEAIDTEKVEARTK